METIEVERLQKVKYYQHKIDYASSQLKINKCEPSFVFICIIVLLLFPILLWVYLYNADLVDQNSLQKINCNITKVYGKEDTVSDGYTTWINVDGYLDCFYIVNKIHHIANKLLKSFGEGKISDYQNEISNLQRSNKLGTFISVFYETYDPSINHWTDFSEKLGADFSVCIIISVICYSMAFLIYL